MKQYSLQQVFEDTRSFIKKIWDLDLNLGDQIVIKNHYVPRVLEEFAKMTSRDESLFSPNKEVAARFMWDYYGTEYDHILLWRGQEHLERIRARVKEQDDAFHLI